MARLTHDEVGRIELSAFDRILAAGLGHGDDAVLNFDDSGLDQADREAIRDIVRTLVAAAQPQLALTKPGEPWASKRCDLVIPGS